MQTLDPHPSWPLSSVGACLVERLACSVSDSFPYCCLPCAITASQPP